MNRRGLWLIIGAFFLINMFVWWAIALSGRNNLAVTFLNIGQGDAILIETPTHKHVLIDGGPDRSVLRELPKVIGPLDRSIDLVVATHSDKDHIAGLIDVFKQYDVGAFMESDNIGDTSYASMLEEAGNKEEGVVRVGAKRGMRIHLGGGAYADVLYPDRSVQGQETNTGSIVLKVVYGTTEFLLTGDAPSSVEDWLVALDGEDLRSDVLKAGHHGSRTSTDALWLETVKPQFVVISAGANNSYGHPHPETISRIQEEGATVLSTVNGRVRFLSDGATLQISK